MIFHLEKRWKRPEKVVFGGKKVQFPNYVQLYLTTVIFDEKRAFSVDKTELLS